MFAVDRPAHLLPVDPGPHLQPVTGQGTDLVGQPEIPRQRTATPVRAAHQPGPARDPLRRDGLDEHAEVVERQPQLAGSPPRRQVADLDLEPVQPVAILVLGEEGLARRPARRVEYARPALGAEAAQMADEAVDRQIGHRREIRDADPGLFGQHREDVVHQAKAAPVFPPVSVVLRDITPPRGLVRGRPQRIPADSGSLPPAVALTQMTGPGQVDSAPQDEFPCDGAPRVVT
ncbi:hypothetical protein BMG523Draft_02029 [Frankia sp. BMG5.23]|nr:hypothetical protein BMG523Draft_02029 [Frankia sp. BMG5.23]